MIKEILKHIPDTLNVNDPDVDKDPKCKFILDEYRNTSWDTEVPCITDTTTFGDIKNTFETLPAKQVLEILDEYKEKFLTDTKDTTKVNIEFSKKEAMKTFLHFTIDIVIVTLAVALGYGLFTGTLSATQIIQSLIEFMGKAFGAIFGGPDPY